LARFLETVRANRAFFSDDASRQRLKGNPHVDTLVENLDDAELDKEIESAYGSDPVVAKLRDIRNAVIAHSAADEIRRGTPAAHRRWLPHDDIETLLDRAATITGKYSLHFRASLWGSPGSDDY
jgi:hypothetical protein